MSKFLSNIIEKEDYADIELILISSIFADNMTDECQNLPYLKPCDSKK